MIHFQNTYSQLPEALYENIKERYFPEPKILKLNDSLIQQLGLDFSHLSENDLAQLLTSGFSKNIKTHPLALAYAGHQFGYYVPQLGDGRAVLVGEILDTRHQRFDLHLKGSGQTRFSRRGDGRATLNSVLREYIMSEALHGLNVPTTRSLSICATGESVQREEVLPGAVLGRIAQSHIRVGTFQYANSLSVEALKQLADYAIQRHDADLEKISAVDGMNKYMHFFRRVVQRQKNLLVQWMSLGFIHGVMNTDNMAISGETIDFGPCAFMDEFDPSTVYSFIDRHGRYAYGNQPQIAQWNLLQLGHALTPLFLDSSSENKKENFIQSTLNQFSEDFNHDFKKTILKKMGLDFAESVPEDDELVQEFHQLMYTHKADYTLSFRSLSEILKGHAALEKSLFANTQSSEIHSWKDRWLKKMTAHTNQKQLIQVLESVNPLYIPRNHLVEKAIQDAVHNQNLNTFEKWVEVLKNPYQLHADHQDWILPPKESERVQHTFCGT